MAPERNNAERVDTSWSGSKDAGSATLWLEQLTLGTELQTKDSQDSLISTSFRHTETGRVARIVGQNRV